MTIQEAIETLCEIHDTYLLGGSLDHEALKLGIGALKRVKECGCPARCGLLERLPGETPEEENGNAKRD